MVAGLSHSEAQGFSYLLSVALDVFFNPVFSSTEYEPPKCTIFVPVCRTHIWQIGHTVMFCSTAFCPSASLLYHEAKLLPSDLKYLEASSRASALLVYYCIVL